MSFACGVGAHSGVRRSFSGVEPTGACRPRVSGWGGTAMRCGLGAHSAARRSCSGVEPTGACRPRASGWGGTAMRCGLGGGKGAWGRRCGVKPTWRWWGPSDSSREGSVTPPMTSDSAPGDERRVPLCRGVANGGAAGSFPTGFLPNWVPSQLGSFPTGLLPNWVSSQTGIDGRRPVETGAEWGSVKCRVIWIWRASGCHRNVRVVVGEMSGAPPSSVAPSVGN